MFARIFQLSAEKLFISLESVPLSMYLMMVLEGFPVDSRVITLHELESSLEAEVDDSNYDRN